MFQIKNLKKLYILALKNQTFWAHSHLKEEKARTKFLEKFRSTEKINKQKHPWRSTLSCFIIRKGLTARGEGRLFYLNCLYCENGLYVGLLLVNWKILILFIKLHKTYHLKLEFNPILRIWQERTEAKD